MAHYGILAMTLAAAAVCLLSLWESRGNPYTAKNLFLAAWLYYGFSAGFDLLTGAEVPYKWGEVDLLGPAARGDTARVMLHYWTCGAAFLIAYHIGRRRSGLPVDRSYGIQVPPAWMLVAVHVAVAAVFAAFFLDMDRMTRAAMVQASARHKFLLLLVPLVLALDMVLIVQCRDRCGRLAWALSLALSLITGNRVYVLLVFLVAVYRWRPRLTGWKLASMIGGCALVIFSFKIAYSVGLGWWQGDRVDASMIYANLQFSLAALDAHASYLISVFYLRQASPLWLGASYCEIPWCLTWPRFLGGHDVRTLAEMYMQTYHPDLAARGGGMAFSAISEAWLNFAGAGPILLGLVWGVATRCFDRARRGCAFYVFLFMTARLFRSDFATLYKNWIVVWGLLFASVLALLAAYTILLQVQRALRAQRDVVVGPRGGSRARHASLPGHSLGLTPPAK
jgi:hypothetical protein